MVKDRLEDFLLKANLPQETSLTIDEANEVTSPLLTTNGVVDDDANLLFTLLHDLGGIYSQLKGVNKEIESLRVIVNHNRRDEFEDKIVEVKKHLHEIKRSINQVRDAHINCLSPLLQHIMSTHLLSLTVLSSDALTDLSDLMADAHNRHKQYIKKELLITSGHDNISDDKLDELLDKPPAVFSQDLLQETNIAKQTLTEIRQRHDQFIKLEGSIVELNQLFQDLALMVSEQGEKVDLIENNVYEASEKTATAKKETATAARHHMSAIKKKACITVVAVTIIGVLLLIIILSFTGS